jgi:hypothetical protein
MPDVEDSRMSKLPGTLPPEIEVLTDAAVKDAFAAAPYGVALDEVLAPVEDHHGYVAAIAKALMLDKSVVATVACGAYAGAREPGDFAGVVSFIRNGLHDRR